MTAQEYFERCINSGQINDDTVTRMKTDKDEIVWLMEDYSKYILHLTQPNIVGSSTDMDVLDYNPYNPNSINNLIQ